MKNPVTVLQKSIVVLQQWLFGESSPSYDTPSWSWPESDVEHCLMQHLPATENDRGVQLVLPSFLSAYEKHRVQYPDHGYDLDSLVERWVAEIAQYEAEFSFIHQTAKFWHEVMEQVLWLGCFATELKNRSATIAELELGGFTGADIYAKYCLLTPREACVLALSSLVRKPVMPPSVPTGLFSVS
ncbi:hypothetical protein [Marinagarivorans cellulosilyticus]|uniref:Uncharacterized protein n=1 Tax=Marinagarivorans cellulosilyticus TaxID=2721545 RepID=A0AAN2BK67_9GAMM|nr:hypothetical protein [Marinagarivorans cellulosilyticus]BCD97684.1 hypothetical protein MARGE09_P1885 [Marinagarivorans cellulosilyticus]